VKEGTSAMAPDSNEPEDPNGPQDGKKDQAGDKAVPPAEPPAPAAQDAAPPAPPAPPPPPKTDPLKEPVASIAVDMLKQRFPNAIQEVTYHAGQTMVRLPVDRFVEIATFLRDEPDLKFDFLSNLTAVHWPDKPMPFEVVYHLFSIPKRHALTLKLEVAEGEEAPTACGVWATANWQEREVFDLFGIRFTGHPDMTRIMMTDEWVGHPLRKDYPLEGKAEDHLQYREVVTADHVYRFDKAPLRGFGWKKQVDKTGAGKG
jgi:NADH-quinone oxidoreductase subunit C